MRILDKYIMRSILDATIVVSAVVFSLLFFMSVVGEVSPNISVLRIFLLGLMAAPKQFYNLFPISVFLGVLISLSRLSQTSQLLIFRASGVSMRRITISVVKTVVLIVCVATVIAETVVPKLQFYYAQAENQQGRPLVFSPFPAPRSVWVRQGDTFTHIAAFKNTAEMQGVTRYFFNRDEKLERASYAKMGQLQAKQWHLYDLKESVFHSKHVITDEKKVTNFNLHIKPHMEAFMDIPPDRQNLWRLYETIRYQHAFGLSASENAFAFWKRIMQPFSTIVLAMLAMPFVFGSFRDASASYRVMLGVILGVVFYTVNQLFGPITVVYEFPPFLAALMPTFAFAVLALLLVRS